jgi:hypothetical protein
VTRWVVDLKCRCNHWLNTYSQVCDPASGTAKGGVGGPTIECSAGVGGISKGVKGPKGSGSRRLRSIASETWISDAARDYEYSSEQQDACGEEAAERGYVAKQNGKAATGMQAHLLYNSDGHYIKQAACYIAKQFKGVEKSSGA